MARQNRDAVRRSRKQVNDWPPMARPRCTGRAPGRSRDGC
jgi:hypothetical protein